MNRAEAKRLACNRSASILETAMAEGWPFNTDEFFDDDDQLTADGRRVDAALRELIAELTRRG